MFPCCWLERVSPEKWQKQVSSLIISVFLNHEIDDITVNKNVLSALLNKTFPCFLLSGKIMV